LYQVTELHTIWVSTPPDGLALEMVQMMDGQAKAVRAMRRKQATH
jgi:hypothetical protein